MERKVEMGVIEVDAAAANLAADLIIAVYDAAIIGAGLLIALVALETGIENFRWARRRRRYMQRNATAYLAAKVRGEL